jgi:hypothetical protein
MLYSSLIENFHFGFDILLNLYFSLIQFFFQQLRTVLDKNVFVNLIGLVGVSHTNNVKLLLDLFFII